MYNGVSTHYSVPVYINSQEAAISRNTIVTKKAPERAFLVTVATKRSQAKAVEDSITELTQLTRTAGARAVGNTVQRLVSPNRAYYVGSGKLEELITLKKTTGYNLVIFDDELTPLQQRNLEEALGVKVIDRVALILDIFGRHAHTSEGKMQVELAQHQYLLPRLAGQWSHLERLGGGIGTRGPGESQLETDKRLIRRKIQRLEARIEEVRKHRALYRQQRQRQGIPVVALVGYTNSGKSSLLNALSRADVLVEDKLFATLDPITRRISLPGGGAALLTDTVGFIRKLPPTIITAFRATLEEISQADLLVHVVDLTSHNAVEQCQTVETILAELKIAAKPRLTVLNKIDLLLDKSRQWDEDSALDYLSNWPGLAGKDTLLISALAGWGLGRLREEIKQALLGPPKPPGRTAAKWLSQIKNKAPETPS